MAKKKESDNEEDIGIKETTKSNNLINLLLKNSNNKFASTISKSNYFNKEPETIDTEIPMLNVALNGKVDGGLRSGVTLIAGQSKHFKSLFAISMVVAFQKKYKSGVVLFYDTEGGVTKSYMENFGVDMERVIWIPVSTVEDLIHEVSKQFDFLKKQDNTENKVCIFIDSMGQIASKKETDDAIENNLKVDLTRPKKIKSFYRITCLDTLLLDIPMIVINHTYQSQDFIPREIVGGGQSNTLSANNVWVIGKRKLKDGEDQSGNAFVIKLDKSRFCKEGSKIPINVYFDKGIAKYSGLDELAIEFGIVEEIKLGRSKGLKFQDLEISEKENDFNEEFWKFVLENSDLKEKIESKYLL